VTTYARQAAAEKIADLRIGHSEITYSRFTINPDTGVITDVATGKVAGEVFTGSDGYWRGRAFLDGPHDFYITGPWLSAYAAADCAWGVAAVKPREGSRS
jgi:hypothetical protein